MTLNANDVRDEYTASAGQTIFNYTFKIYTSTDLNVYVTPAGQACSASDLTTAYTVAGVGAEAGGSITLNTPTSAGDLVTIVSAIPTSRTTDYQNNGDFRPDTVNDDFDRTVSLVKQANEKASRALLFPECLQSATSLTLPEPVSQRFVRWKTDLSGLENVTLSSSGIAAEVSVTDYTALRGLTSSDYTDGQVIFVTNDGIAGQFVVKTGTVTDNGGTLIVFTDDSNRYAEREGVNGVFWAEWFGLEESASVSQLTAIQDAITAAEVEDGTVKVTPRQTYAISGTITLSSGVILDLGWSDLRPLTNANMITVRPGGTLKNCRAVTTGITFSSKIAVYSPTSNTLGAQYPPWINGLQAIMSDSSGGNTGDAVSYDSATYWIQETIANDIVVYFGRRAIDNSTSESGLFCNGNVINGLVTHNSAYTIYEDANNGTCAGNMYDAVMSQGNTSTYGQMRLNSGARVNTLMWDGSPIDFINNDNLVTAYGRGHDLPRSDAGRNNKIISGDSYYSDLRSITDYNDKRVHRFLPGWRSFEDFIMGQVDPRWTQTISAGGSITYANYAYGSSSFLRGSAAVLSTGTTSSDIVQLDFNGQGVCRAAMAPLVHATIRTSSTTADRRVFAGLYTDANNYIGFEIDPSAYGDVVWRAVTKSGGTATTTTTVLGTSARVSFITVLVKSSSVEFRIGIVPDNNDACANGVLTQEDATYGFTTTHTTNIPTSANLEPSVFVQTQAASSKSINLLDFQYSSAIAELY